MSPRTATPTRDMGSRAMQTRPQPVLRLSAPSGMLRLRAEPTEQRHIQWAEDVVDNEGMGRKSSKGTFHSSCYTISYHVMSRYVTSHYVVSTRHFLACIHVLQTLIRDTVCCIYHKPRAADESSSDESSSDDSSSSDSDSDSEPDNSTARPSRGRDGPRGRRPQAHDHAHGDCEHEHEHEHSHDGPSGMQKKRAHQRRKPSPNAYEKMPKNKK